MKIASLLVRDAIFCNLVCFMNSIDIHSSLSIIHSSLIYFRVFHTLFNHVVELI